MDIYSCTIVDSEGFTVVDFLHKSESLNKAEQFELLVLDAVRKRDGEERFLFTAPDDSDLPLYKYMRMTPEEKLNN